MLFMLFTNIVKFMVPGSKVQAVGWSQYFDIMKMFSMIDNLFSIYNSRRYTKCTHILFMKSSTKLVNIMATVSEIQALRGDR